MLNKVTQILKFKKNCCFRRKYGSQIQFQLQTKCSFSAKSPSCRVVATLGSLRTDRWLTSPEIWNQSQSLYITH